jgi:predicted DNA-binding ribbon-helix-helix protein
MNYCVVFATLQVSFSGVTVARDFPVLADPYSKMGVGFMHITNGQSPSDPNGIRAVKSPVVKRSIVVGGHKTSVSLEDAFWTGLKEIAGGHHLTLSDMVAGIDADRQHGNLSSAIRLFVLDFYRRQLAELKAAAPAAHDIMGRSVRASS